MVKEIAECMFCSNAPCTCNAKPKKEPKPRAKKPPMEARPDVPQVQPTHSVPGPMATGAGPMQGATYGTGISAPRSPVGAPARPAVDPNLAYAVEVFVLSGVVHRNEIPRLRKLFQGTRPAALVARVASWKRRRRDV